MKKKLSLLLALLMVFSIFAVTACSDEPELQEAVTLPAEIDPAETPDETDETDEPEDPAPVGGIGTPENPVVVTVLFRDPIEEEEATIRAIEEGMARQGNFVRLEFPEPPAGNYNEVVPIAFRTGQISPDVLWFQAGHLPLGQEGLFEDLMPYINNSTYVRALLEPFNWERLSSFPYTLFLAHVRVQVPVVRTDWLDQLSTGSTLLANPTVDNWLAFMTEIVDSGLAQYATTIDGNLQRLDTIFAQAFGVSSSFMRDDDGNWISFMISDQERDKLELYARLYAEGLLDPEYITNDWQAMEQKFYSGEVGIIAGGAGPVTQIYNDRMVELHGPASALTVLPPAIGVGQGLRSLDVTMEDRGFVINRRSPQEVKDAAFAVFEFMASPEGRMIDLLGVEGIMYNIVDGEIEIVNRRMEPVFWTTTNGFDPGMPFMAGHDPFSYDSAFMASVRLTQRYFMADTYNVILPVELSPIWDSLVSAYREFVADVIRGLRPISDFEALRAQWDSLGWPEVQAWLNDNLG